MIFTYKKWEAFCKSLSDSRIISQTAQSILCGTATEPYLVLKHDVETDVMKAYVLAAIESKFGHRGSYYVQAYLLGDEQNVQILQSIQNMGHEVSYHYDVMDACKGDIDAAITEFEKHKNIFESAGFQITTVCQHGNPVVDRVGYTSNRDFFRNARVKALYPEIADIMVNFKSLAHTDYLYYSDAGRRFQMIYDPLFNDLVNSDDKNVYYEDLVALQEAGTIGKENVIISTHPHRWTKSAVEYKCKETIFKGIKCTAKVLMKIPLMKRIMGKYYYLAKKI